jgi:deoxyhypusine synthase
MRQMSFSARQTAIAADIFDITLNNKQCIIFLRIAGSTSAAGCRLIYTDMVKYNMVDAIIASGATIVDMDFF